MPNKKLSSSACPSERINQTSEGFQLSAAFPDSFFAKEYIFLENHSIYDGLLLWRTGQPICDGQDIIPY